MQFLRNKWFIFTGSFTERKRGKFEKKNNFVFFLYFIFFWAFKYSITRSRNKINN